MLSAKKIWLCVLLASASYVGCKNTNSNDNKNRGQNNVLKNTWYKRYTGTVQGEPVVVNLQCSGKTVQGSYYYIDMGMITELFPPGYNADGGKLTFIERNPAERMVEDDSAANNNWQLDIQGTTATGKWMGGNGKRTADIDLKEDYTNNACLLDVLMKGDSITERKGVVRVSATSLYNLVQPSAKMNKADADFLRTAILHFLGGEFEHAENINDYILQGDKKYFQNFEKLLADIKIDREAHEDWEYSFAQKRRLDVLYNNNGMLVLKLEEFDHTGGGMMGIHSKYRYACIDMEQKRLWQLKDVMDMDAAILAPQLDREARNIFKIPKGPLTEKLRVDSIPLTDNMYITNTGITFCYNPGVVAREEEGEICLFIPYTRLKKQLKEDFKKRMPL